MLIKNGADANAKANLNWTSVNDHEVRIYMLKDWTPLFEAINEEELEVAQVLINNGAQVNATMQRKVRDAQNDSQTNYSGWTPLMEAVYQEHTGAVKMLLKNGANRNATTVEGLTALQLAKDLNHKEIVQILAQ